MRKTTLVLILALVAGPASAVVSEKEVGLGVVAGYPSGGTLKYWYDDASAIDFGVGIAGSPVVWGDMLWHAWDILPQPASGRLGAYFGGGPRLEFASDTEFGLRAIAGLSWRLPRHPVELFAELGPVFRLTQGGHVEADGGVGVRVSFLGSSRR